MANLNFCERLADASVSMLKFKKFQATLFQGLLCTSFILSATTALAATADTVEVPVQKGEDLMGALKRVHPCFNNPGVKIPTRVFDDNPEKVVRGGGMALAHPTLKVPASFLDPKQCGPREIAAVKTESLPEAKASPVAESADGSGETAAAKHAGASKAVSETKLAAEAGHSSAEKSEGAPAEAAPSENRELYKFRGGPELKPEHSEKQEAGEEKEAKGEPKEEEESGPHYKNHVTVLGLLDYSRLAATVNGSGAMPILVSKPQPGFELVYSRELTPNWSVGFNYMYLNTTFQDLDGTPFTELTSALHEFAFSARYRLSHTSRISLLIGGAQVDELSTSPVDGSLLIDHTFRITGSFIFWQELGKVLGFEILGGLGAQTFIPTDWSQDSVGVGELFRLLFERDLSHRWMVEFGALGSYERQETQSESHSELSIAFGLGLSFRF
jgi:hypothetical protein